MGVDEREAVAWGGGGAQQQAVRARGGNGGRGRGGTVSPGDGSTGSRYSRCRTAPCGAGLQAPAGGARKRPSRFRG